MRKIIKVLQILFKIFLYFLDVISDWVNAAEQISGMDFYDHFMRNKDKHQQPLNLPNWSDCQQMTVEGPIWGVVSISLSWLPGLVSLMATPKENKLALLLRLIVWPLFVPFQM